MTITELVEQAKPGNIDSDFWGKEDIFSHTIKSSIEGSSDQTRLYCYYVFTTYVTTIVNELFNALQAMRDGHDDIFAIIFADAYIKLASIANMTGLQLERAIKDRLSMSQPRKPIYFAEQNTDNETDVQI